MERIKKIELEDLARELHKAYNKFRRKEGLPTTPWSRLKKWTKRTYIETLKIFTEEFRILKGGKND